MFLPSAYVETDLAELDRLIACDNFVTLVTVDSSLPVINHLPVLYRRVGDQVELQGHWARVNPQARHRGRATAVVHGPHAYVSPAWYPDKEAAARVPTWNYAVAHLQGTLETFEEDSALGALVGGLSRQHEQRIGSDWEYDHTRVDLRRQLRGITGFRLHVDRIELKFKLSQNHPSANRASVAAALSMQARDDSRAVARLMQPRSSQPASGD